MRGRVDIQLLGGVKITGPKGVVPNAMFGGRRARVMFAVLAWEYPASIDHHDLADVLWPGPLPRTWRPALRSAFSHVRAALAATGCPETSVDASEGTARLHLPPNAAIDIARARADVAAAVATNDPGQTIVRARAALAVLGGPLLASESGPWVERRRDELLQMRLVALHALSTALVATGEPELAIAAATEAVRLQPFREPGHRALMVAHAANGDRTDALRVYARLRTLLVEEMGLDPSPETEELYVDLLRGGGQTRLPALRPIGAVQARRPEGLENEADALADWWAGVASGGRSVLALGGTLGAGKTTLAAGLASAAAADGTAVLWIKGADADGIDQLEQGTVTSSPRLLAVVDDADRIGGPVSRVLGIVMDRPAHQLGLMLIHRTEQLTIGDPLVELFGDLVAIGRLDHLAVGPRTTPQITAIAAETWGMRASAGLRHLGEFVAGEAGGNLGFAAEWLHGLREAGFRPEASVDLDQLAVPPTVKDLAGRWLRGMPTEHVDVLTVAALLGSRFPLDQLAARNPVVALDAVERAIARGVLTSATPDGHYRFVHPIMARILREQLSHLRRQRLIAELTSTDSWRRGHSTVP